MLAKGLPPPCEKQPVQGVGVLSWRNACLRCPASHCDKNVIAGPCAKTVLPAKCDPGDKAAQGALVPDRRASPCRLLCQRAHLPASVAC